MSFLSDKEFKDYFTKVQTIEEIKQEHYFPVENGMLSQKDCKRFKNLIKMI